jgi:hypothetical protein
VIEANKIRFLTIGSGATPEPTLRAAIADVVRACEANGVAEGESLIVFELAWQRIAQQRRQRALHDGSFDREIETQRDHLRRLDALVADDDADRYEVGDDGRMVWRGPTQAVIQELSNPMLPDSGEVTATPDAA